MCVASAVTDYYQNKWTTLPYPGIDSTPIIYPKLPDGKSLKWITLEEWEDYQNLKRIVEGYDERTNQPECIKPELAEFERQVVEVLIKRGVLTATNQD